MKILAENEIDCATEAFSSASARDIWSISEIKMLNGSTKQWPEWGAKWCGNQELSCTNGSRAIRKSFWNSNDDDNSSNGDLVIRLGDNISVEGTANQGYSIGMGKK